MKKYFTIFFFIVFGKLCFSQCVNADSLYTNNITYLNALANWKSAPVADHYTIHYRLLGTTNWSNLGNIDGSDTTRNIPQLLSDTTYEWQIKTFCDTSNQSNQPNSGWSISDTFTTIVFVPAPFNPQLFYGMSSTLCNTHVSFNLRVMQSQNEPDIGTSEITSDGGSFDISSLGVGDTVGTAQIATPSDTIMTTLTVGIVTGSNSALIYSVDTSGILGFFTIENISGGGVKISSTSPPDGNNYTSGYNSILIFDDLFVTPITPGVLSFTANIVSELNDLFYMVDSSTVIFCNTGVSENESGNKKLLKIVNALGEDSPHRKNTLLFYIYKDGTVEKKLILE